MSMRGKFTLKPSPLSQHTANFNKILEQAPTPKIEIIELVKPAEIIPSEPLPQKEPKQEDLQDGGEKKKFVFGEQLTDRVVNADKSETETTNGTKEEASTETKSAALWTSQQETEDKFDNDLYTILRLNCKLFVLESDKANWAERGYGVLKLIDTSDGSNCKIMMWTDKCFRLILNTKLFDKMQIDRANKKSIRFNAFDSGTIRIFLIKTANPNDCDELHDVLQSRLSEYTSKLSTSQTSENSKANKNVVFKCDCNLYKESDEQICRTASLELYSFLDPSKPSRSHQLFVDIVKRDSEQDTYLSTYLKLIKVSKQISKTNESFEFEIDEYSYSVDSPTEKHKYRVSLNDKDSESQIMDLFKKEPRVQMDDSSNGGFDRDEDETQEDQDTSYDESNEANRKSDSLNETDGSDSSASSSEGESEKASNVFDQETGETKRKRKSESDDSETEKSVKKQEVESEVVSHKRTAEEVEESDAFKKTRVEENQN